MKDTLEIEIRGELNTGKSTVAFELAQVLEAYGIKVETHDIDLNGMPEDDEWFSYQDDRLAALGDRPLKAIIKVVQIPRSR